MKNTLLIISLAISTSILAQKLDFNTKKGIMIKGYDVVAYFENEAKKGSEKFSTDYENATYYFTSKENLECFKRDPQKYIPQFGGYCAYAIAAKGEKMGIDPKTFEIRDNKLYLFYNSWWNNTLKLWKKENTQELITQANKNWERLKFK